MPTWTFTTTDPATALQLSTFCVGLGHVTEIETADKPAPVQTRRKAAPIDHGCWRDPEARKVRAKAQAWGRRPTQGVMPDVARTYDAAQDYAGAMGWTKEEAAAKIKAHQAHLDLGHVTEIETADKPAPVQTRRKAAPIDHGCWRDPEARKVRAKVNAWAAANVRRKGGPVNSEDRYLSGEQAYADAMGWTKEKAASKIEYHHACEAEFTRTNGQSARP